MANSMRNDLLDMERQSLDELQKRVHEAIRSNQLMHDDVVVAVDEARIPLLTTSASSGSVSIWGVTLLEDDERTNVILLKFLKDEKFRVKESFDRIKNTLRRRHEFGIDHDDYEEGECNDVIIRGKDREGRPVCYNMVHIKSYASRFKTGFVRSWINLVEMMIRELIDFRPGQVNAIFQVNDLHGCTKEELRELNHVIPLLRDHYPQSIAYQVFINAPWLHWLQITTMRKFQFVQPSQTCDTLLWYICAEQLPISYGGLCADPYECNTNSNSKDDHAVASLAGKITLAGASDTDPTGNAIPVSDFPRFTLVASVPQDHAYFWDKNPAAAANTTSAFLKKVTNEWKDLRDNLPETIFVQVYEDKISHLRAAIVGAPGTPYQDGLFFFDMFLPLDYPSGPPKVRYRSFGYRINPNLYRTGLVCLALIRTSWFGDKSEEWGEGNRLTILQLLLSIQAVVMNEKPFYNEPAYSGPSGPSRFLSWQKKAAMYNEEVFVLCCKSALRLLRRPLENFEALVVTHFRERGVAILATCQAYRKEQARVGGNLSGGEVSSRFKGAMEKVYGNLVDELAKNGAPVEEFVKQLEGEREAKAKKMSAFKKWLSGLQVKK